jgi:Spy/CpxP family protein refolding chaperone
MKTQVIVVFLLCIVTASQATLTTATCKPTDDGPPHVVMGRASADNDHVPADLLVITPFVPRGPCDLLRHYELETASIAGLKDDIARTPAARADPSPSPTGELVAIAMPFSSLQLSPPLVEYLGLTTTQVKAIQKLMGQERPTAEPLMHELQKTSSELRAAIQQRRNNNNEGATPRLAARQAQLLKQLMRSNLRLRQRINGVLNPRQRKKLDSFRRTSEVTVGEGN